MKKVAKQKQKLEYGGSATRGRAKSGRPVPLNAPLRVTLRTTLAKGRMSLARKPNAEFISELLERLSGRWKVTIRESTIGDNTLDLVVQAKSKEGFSNFFRVLGAQVALKVSGARKGQALGRRFWDLPMYSRVE